MRIKLLAILVLLSTHIQTTAEANSKKRGPTVQEVNFESMSLKGTIRSPDGSYLVQKRGIKFKPLYEVQKDLDAKIRDSVHYRK